LKEFRKRICPILRSKPEGVLTLNQKNLLIVNNNLGIGGVQRSLVNLLNEIKNDYNVTLFLFHTGGEYIGDIPEQITVIGTKGPLKVLGVSHQQSRKLGWSFFLTRGVLALYSRLINNRLPIKLLVNTEKKKPSFDIAISFLHDFHEKILYGGCNQFVLDKVIAKKKIAFVHCDFLRSGGNTLNNRKLYRRFDKIAVVSTGTRKSFVAAIPELNDRVYSINNCHQYSEYIRLSKIDPIEYSEDSLNIITVSRLSPEKGLIRGLEVVKQLSEEGYKVHWHIVGDGPLAGIILKEIEELHLHENVTLYGNQKNPYRYIKNADVFLLPSFHEAAPMVFAEAKCLGVPIISTNTTSAQEMVMDDGAGWVCENSEQGIYSSLKMLLNHPEIIVKCREELLSRIYDNKKAIEEFHQLLNSSSQ